MTRQVFALTVLLLVGSASAKKKLYSWGEALEKCGKDGKEDYPVESAQCMAHYHNQTKVFHDCEAAYCTCSGSKWVEEERRCDTTDSTCGMTCGCMEKCYAPFMKCTFQRLVGYFNHTACDRSEMKECIVDTEEDYRDECKRGVREGRISWMETPLPDTDCDEDLICAGGAFAPHVLLVAAALLVALAF